MRSWVIFSFAYIFSTLEEDDMLVLCLRRVFLPPNGLWVFEHRDLCKVNYSKLKVVVCKSRRKGMWASWKLQREQKNCGSYWYFIQWRKGEKIRLITIWERKERKTGSESSSEFWGKSESEWQHSGSDGCYSRHIGCLRIWSQNTRNNIKAKFRLCSIWVNELGRFPSPDLLYFF